MNELTAIKLYALVTAGRYYTPERKKRVADLIARAERLTEEERADFERYVFDGRFDKIRTLIDCRNAYVLAVTDGDERDAEYLRCAAEAFSFAEGLWYDRDRWVAFANAKDKSFETVFEGGFFSYAVGDVARAKDAFGDLAEYGHLPSIRLLIAVLEERGEYDAACEWLTVAKRAAEELYHEPLGERDQKVLDAYLESGKREAYDAAYRRYVDFFNANAFGGMQFSAGGKYYD
ncbi:MAG: hypothetical protein IJ735_04110 [Clostridia bacterium]|nr:hypothetical protein [Clostridia bacterium]